MIVITNLDSLASFAVLKLLEVGFRYKGLLPRDLVLTNKIQEKVNFDTCYIINSLFACSENGLKGSG